MSPVASARTIRVADWLPVLPPVPMSSGMKKARATAEFSVSAWDARMPVVTMLMPSKEASHVTRLP